MLAFSITPNPPFTIPISHVCGTLTFSAIGPTVRVADSLHYQSSNNSSFGWRGYFSDTSSSVILSIKLTPAILESQVGLVFRLAYLGIPSMFPGKIFPAHSVHSRDIRLF